MKVKELIAELSKYPEDLEVMAAGENADRVVYERCEEHEYLRIIQNWNIDLILGSAGLKE